MPKAWSQLLEEREDITSLKRDNYLAVSINAVDLKNGLRNVAADCYRLRV
jgi:hypothetical protein